MSKRVGFFRTFWNSFFTIKRKGELMGTDHLGNKYFEFKAGWMRNRRKDPPTIEELQRNIAAMHTIKARVRALEERDRLQQGFQSSTVPTATHATDAQSHTGPAANSKGKYPEYKDLEISPGEFKRKLEEPER